MPGGSAGGGRRPAQWKRAAAHRRTVRSGNSPVSSRGPRDRESAPPPPGSFFFSSRRRHTRSLRDWSSDVCSSDLGYSHVTQVVSPGEYSFRGGVIDLFPMGSAVPYRIDLFDDEIDSIRTFDVDTQRSIYKVNDVRLLPAREFPTDEDARTRFRQNFREKFEGDPSRSQLYKDVSHGVFAAGIEYYLPLFYDGTATLIDYLPQSTTAVLHGDVQ